MIISDYIHNRNYWLSRMDARVKIISAIVLLVMVLTYEGISFPLFLFLCGVGLSVDMKIHPRVLFIRYLEPFFIVTVLLVLKVFFTGKVPLFSLEFMGMTVTGFREGFLEGMRIGCRIMGAVTIVAVLGFSTPFNQFMAGLSWLRLPRGFVEVSMFAYRYIFMLFEDAMLIYSAQKNRLGYSTIKRGFNSFGILAGALVIKAFDQSQKTTVAMTQRGYDGVMPNLEHKPFKTLEIGGVLSFIIVMGILWKIW
ncbi:MAG: cobalt ECF transporter T component CbiQ [Smithella sp.]